MSLHQTARLLSSGFAVARNFLAPDILRLQRDLAEPLAGEPCDPCCSRTGTAIYPLNWQSELVALTLLHGSFAGVARASGARDLKWISAYIAEKAPMSPALEWHQDWWCWSHPATFKREASQIALIYYLCDVDETNGAPRVIARSHHDRRSLPGGAARHAREATVALNAGDALLIDYRLLHATHPNKSAAPRTGLIFTFAPDWAALPEDIRAHLFQHFALPSARERDRASQKPYAHLFPEFSGSLRSLALDRDPPPGFALG
jgi:hypothetical protein